MRMRRTKRKRMPKAMAPSSLPMTAARAGQSERFTISSRRVSWAILWRRPWWHKALPVASSPWLFHRRRRFLPAVGQRGALQATSQCRRTLHTVDRNYLGRSFFGIRLPWVGRSRRLWLWDIEPSIPQAWATITRRISLCWTGPCGSRPRRRRLPNTSGLE